MSASLANFTQAQLKMIPVIEPPVGMISNLVDPPTKGTILIITGSILMTAMLISVGVRLYTKLFIMRRRTWDDFTVSIAAVLAIIYFSFCCWAVKEGYGKHLWNISIAQYESKSFQIPSFLINWVNSLVSLFAKSTFFLFYSQLFYPIPWLRYSIQFGALVNISFYICFIITALFFTAPFPGESWVTAQTSPRFKGAERTAIYIASGSLILDVYIFFLPMFGIWNLQLARSRKLGLGVIFGTGFIACIASSLNVYYSTVLEKDYTDYTFSVMPTLVVGVVEHCVGISASCMPAFSTFMRHEPTWSSLKLKLSSSSIAFKSIIRRTKSSPSQTVLATSQGPGGPYPDIEAHPPVELAYTNTTSTFIPSGEGGDDSLFEDGTHLKSSIRQEIEENTGRI